MTPKDVVAALLTPVVMIASTLSYTALIFSGPLAGMLPVGIGYGLLSAGLVAIAVALFSQIPFAIAGPDSKPVAVLAALAGAIAADCTARGETDAIPTTVLIGLVGGTVVTGGLLFLFGSVKTGRWVRYVPYPVIGGFMGASGCLLCAGAFRVLIGTGLSWDHRDVLMAGAHPMQLAAGILLTATMILIRRIKHFLAYPILLVVGTAGILALLQFHGIWMAEARTAGWLLDIPVGAMIPDPWLSGAAVEADYSVLVHNGATYVALILVTTSTLLLSSVAVEVETRLDVDVDRELRLNGIANLAVGALGGMVGTLSASRTIFNYKVGARHRASGVIAGLLCLGALMFGTRLIGYVPVPLLGAMLLQIGLAMVKDWLFDGRSRMQWGDYLQMVLILLAILELGFVAGIIVGVVTACVTFAIHSSRIRLVKRGLTRSDYASRVERSAHQHEKLLRWGQDIRIIWLHGSVFFGSANRLLLDIKALLTNPGERHCRMIILDFRQVLSIDSSAVLTLTKLRHLAEREDIVLVISGLPPFVDRALKLGGFLNDEDDPLVKVFPVLDSALEWCEERLLAEHSTREEAIRSADEWLAHEIGGAPLFTRLVSYLEMREHAQHECLFRKGDTADCLYLIYTGRVSVNYHTTGGEEVRLRSMVRHTVVGEMGLYRNVPRGATVKADQPTIVYTLSSEAMTQMEIDDPHLAYAFHKFIIRTLATRLDFANREVAGLEA